MSEGFGDVETERAHLAVASISLDKGSTIRSVDLGPERIVEDEVLACEASA
jgi:hypothetical protein